MLNLLNGAKSYHIKLEFFDMKLSHNNNKVKLNDWYVYPKEEIILKTRIVHSIFEN